MMQLNYLWHEIGILESGMKSFPAETRGFNQKAKKKKKRQNNKKYESKEIMTRWN